MSNINLHDITSRNSSLVQLTDLEHLCVTGVHDIKSKITKEGLTPQQQADVAVLLITTLEHRMSVALTEKFGLTKEQIEKSNFDMTIKSGHFIELISKNE